MGTRTWLLTWWRRSSYKLNPSFRGGIGVSLLSNADAAVTKKQTEVRSHRRLYEY